MDINQFLQQLGQGDQIKDYQHASRLFVGDNFRLIPKSGWLYHVFFDLDPSITRIGREQQIEAGMLVKSADLPKFTFDSKTLNSYNKPNIIQTKIKYDPLNISFHDDHAEVVKNLWFDYYNYYYRDADLGFSDSSGSINPGYQVATKYGKRDKNNFGYQPRGYSSHTGETQQQYIKAIRIYSLHQKRFSEYTLLNPIITSFRHGTHESSSQDTLTNQMTVSYEFVLYASGWVSPNTVKGFAGIHYDHTPSPLTPAGGGTKSVLGPGGVLNLADDIIEDLSKGDFGGAAFKAMRGYKNLKDVNLGQLAGQELSQFGMDILRGNNPMNRVYVPNVGNLANESSAGPADVGVEQLTPMGVATSNGEGIGSQPASTSAGISLAGFGASILAATGTPGVLVAAGVVTGAGALNKLLNVNPRTGTVESVTKLPGVTAAEAAISAIPANSINATAAAGAGTATPQELAAAAASAGVESQQLYAQTTSQNLASGSSTPPIPPTTF